MRSLVAWANGAICGGGKAGVAAVAAKAEPARKANVQIMVAGRRGINIGKKLKRLTPGKSAKRTNGEIRPKDTTAARYVVGRLRGGAQMKLPKREKFGA